MKLLIRIFLATMFLFGFTTIYAAQVPTIHQVYEAAHTGHLTEAQQMMNQVLAAHPESARAHFVMAEVLAAEHRYGPAGSELNHAQQLAPGLPFEKPQAVQSLQARIAEGLHGGMPSLQFGGRHAASSGMSWTVILLIVGCILLLAFVIRALMTPRSAPMNYAGGVPPAGTMGSMSGPFYPYTPRSGSGLMSGLATGLGMGAGFAAGEAVVNHFVNGQSGSPMNTGMPDPSTQLMDDQYANNDFGGNDFGMSDSGGWDDGGTGDGFSDFGGDDGGWS